MSKIDVLVVGGGVAGCAAALAAVREGASTVLLERQDCLGGNATRALVGPWQSFHAGVIKLDGSLPEQVIGGIAQEFVADLTARGACNGHQPDPIGFAGSITPVDAQVVEEYLPAKLAEAGVRIELSRAVTLDDLAEATQLVDATGSAAVARMLDVPVVRSDQPQPLSWLFTMTGVDVEAVHGFQLEHPEQFVLHPAHARVFAQHGTIAVSGFFDLVRQARERGELDVPRDRLLFFSTPTPGEVLINTTRIPAAHPEPEQEGLRQVQELVRWLPEHVPGFGGAQLGRIAKSIGERESYRLVGKYTLNVNDIVKGSRHPDAIARGCFPIDIHQAGSDGLESQGVGGAGWYDIPLGCLENERIENLLCAGRCISTDRSGFASARVIPTAIATGEAAGYIASRRASSGKFKISACLSRISLV
ncbi:FAD-dependent oxidoreductase [bacterium]|nr:FAD-dependent oxidoreductase [bacterium]